MYSGFFLVTVLLTWIAGYYDESTPYFPIEISRTATGWLSGWVFSVGITASVFVFLYSAPQHPLVYASVSGLLLLAWVDDVSSWKWHMIGVFVMGVCTVLFAFLRRPETIGLVVAAGGLWITRILMKMVVLFFNEGGFTRERAMNIMYTGVVQNNSTLTVFKVAGFLQWIVFGMLMQIFY